MYPKRSIPDTARVVEPRPAGNYLVAYPNMNDDKIFGKSSTGEDSIIGRKPRGEGYEPSRIEIEHGEVDLQKKRIRVFVFIPDSVAALTWMVSDLSGAELKRGVLKVKSPKTRNFDIHYVPPKGSVHVLTLVDAKHGTEAFQLIEKY